MGRTPSNKSAKAKASGKAAPAAKSKKSKSSLNTSSDTTSDLEKNKSYIGRRVSKNFDGEIYHGTVTKYTQKHKLWAIKYDDDDREEMNWSELCNAMELHDGHNEKKKGNNNKKGGKQNKRGQQPRGKTAEMVAVKKARHQAAPKAKASPLEKEVPPAAAAVASASPAANAAPAAVIANKNITNNYRVVQKIYPSNGSNSYEEHTILGEYPTREQAEEVARTEMTSHWAFEEWGEKEYANLPPPYKSAHGPREMIADDEDFVDIYIVDVAEEMAKEEKELEEARMSKPPPKPNVVAEMSSDPNERKFGKVTSADIQVDANLFARNPCRIQGGVNRHPNAYPNYTKGTGSFGFLIQRLSDRNYAMRALCLEGYGALYNTYKKPDASYISLVWYPPTNLNEHGKEETIVDGCHLDLIDPTDGKTYLTGPNLTLACVKAGKPVECIFLNGAQSNPGSEISADDIAAAITNCQDSLLCVSMTECKLNANLLFALAQCKKLRGLILENCQLNGSGDERPTDKLLANVLKSCEDLRWCYIKSSLFDNECWNVLANDDDESSSPPKACPKLEVLWVDAPMHTADRIDTARGNHDTIRRALDGRAKETLKLCMINPDQQNRSRYVPLGLVEGGEEKVVDRLDGTERSAESKRVVKMQKGDVGAGSTTSYLNTI